MPRLYDSVRAGAGMTAAERYRHHRAAADLAHKAGDGAAASGHAAAAHAALRDYATAHGLSTDAAAAQIRRASGARLRMRRDGSMAIGLRISR